MAEWRVLYPVILLQVTPLPSLAKLWTTCERASLHFVLSAFVIVIVWEFLQYEFHLCCFFPRISLCVCVCVFLSEPFCSCMSETSAHVSIPTISYCVHSPCRPVPLPLLLLFILCLPSSSLDKYPPTCVQRPEEDAMPRCLFPPSPLSTLFL